MYRYDQPNIFQERWDKGIRNSDMESMIWCAANGRCMACAWPLAQSKEKGCVPMDCSFRPDQQDPIHATWLRRAKLMREIGNSHLVTQNTPYS